MNCGTKQSGFEVNPSWSYSTLSPVSTWMGDCLLAGIPPRYVTKPTRSTQPSIPPGSVNEYQLVPGNTLPENIAGWRPCAAGQGMGGSVIAADCGSKVYSFGQWAPLLALRHLVSLPASTPLPKLWSTAGLESAHVSGAIASSRPLPLPFFTCIIVSNNALINSSTVVDFNWSIFHSWEQHNTYINWLL